jgi:hypothetical protein
MGRIRTIKPEFFTHYELYEAEIESGLPIRLAFAGLWTVSDREGRFEWRPKKLKLSCLPYDDVDFELVLNSLEKNKFVIGYVADGKKYGYIPSWTKHQVVNLREAKSSIPEPCIESNVHARACTVNDNNVEIRVNTDNHNSEDSVNNDLIELNDNQRMCMHVQAHGEREREKEREGNRNGIDIFVAENDDKYADIIKIWNNFAKKIGLAEITQLNPRRKSGVRARIEQKGFDFSLICQKITESDFLRGGNRDGWRVDFDFIFLSPHNWVKILEGKYSNRQPVNKNFLAAKNWINSGDSDD